MSSIRHIKSSGLNPTITLFAYYPYQSLKDQLPNMSRLLKYVVALLSALPAALGQTYDCNPLQRPVRPTQAQHKAHYTATSSRAHQHSQNGRPSKATQPSALTVSNSRLTSRLKPPQSKRHFISSSVRSVS